MHLQTISGFAVTRELFHLTLRNITEDMPG
jgi:hypothetical protein